ncbi:MAG: hypothetical protein K2Q28_10585 [Hyphomicrobium sp.]|nr:hypothetical protein [Hyphomicrobium sp.]
MCRKTPVRITACLAALLPVITVVSAQSAAADRFVANLKPLNADKIGTSASGTANLETADGKRSITIDAAGLPPGMMHLQHFHGFADGKAATCPTAQADTNGDGFIDLLETETMAGTTMLPFHDQPASLEIASDTYPVADKNGAAKYQHTVLLQDVEKALKEKFESPSLALSSRVIFVHGVAKDMQLPNSVKSLPGVPAQVTLPIACGKIEAVK